MNFKEVFKPLEDFYSITNMDWLFSIRHCLTEPTCPTITIKPEGTNITRYSHHCNSNEVEETINALVQLVYAEIVEGKVVGRGNTPFTNSDDDILEKWLEDRKSNKDLEFPYKIFYKQESKRIHEENMKDPQYRKEMEALDESKD